MLTKHLTGSISKFEQRHLRKLSNKNKRKDVVIEEAKESASSFSESDDDHRCEIDDQNEEVNIKKPGQQVPVFGGGSFRITTNAN